LDLQYFSRRAGIPDTPMTQKLLGSQLLETRPTYSPSRIIMPDDADLRDVLESIARDLENRAGNPTYQQAYKKAARVVRSYQRCKLYVPIQTDGTSQNAA
jgi:hypothetical protein